MSDRYDSLSPRDLTITLRSLPRRYGSVLSTATRTPEALSLSDSPGATGESMLALLRRAAGTMATHREAARSMLRSSEPVVTIDRSLLGQLTLAEAVRSLSNDAEKLADDLVPRSSEDWLRVGRVEGDGPVIVVELVRQLVRESIETLRTAEKQAEWIASEAD